VGRRLSIPAAFYLCVSLFAVVWRLVTSSWDFGGCFYQGWVALVGTAFFVEFYPRLSERLRVLAKMTLLPMGAFLQFGAISFAPQALFPFMFVALALFGVLFLLSKSKTPLAGLAFLILIPLGAWCAYGFAHMRSVVRLRSVPPGEVTELRLSQGSSVSPNTVITNREAVERIVRSLKSTTPYSPNHEGIKQPWRLTIAMRDGSSLNLNVGNGNRAHPSFVWIQFGVEVYQNAELRDAFLRASANLWGSHEDEGRARRGS
jgi:hypothetical protein